MNRLHCKSESGLEHRGVTDTSATSRNYDLETRIDREHTPQLPSAEGDAKPSPFRVLYLFAGLICIALGLIGVLLPGLPTTPFILLASWCFSRSSRRLESALLRSRLLGPFLRDWQQHRGIRRPVRYLAVGFVVTTILATCVLSDFGYAFKASIVALACIGLLVIVRIPVLPAGTPDESMNPMSSGRTTRAMR